MAITIYPTGIPDVGAMPWAFTKRKPCEGMYMRRTKNGVAVVALHYSADPDLMTKEGQDSLREYSKEMLEAKWNQEMEMHAEAMEGQLVYPEFSTAAHVVSPSQIPAQLCRYMSIDPHARTPHAMLWIGVDADDDWWVYRELWPCVVYGEHRNLTDTDRQPTYTIRDYCNWIAALEGASIEWHNAHTDVEFGVYREALYNGEKIIARYMDQAGKGFMASGENETPESHAQRYARFGVQAFDPDKRHKGGEDAIRDLLRARPHQKYGKWPRLHISEQCPELIYEFQRHRYKATQPHRLAEQELKQGGVQARTHMLDNLRYLATANCYWEQSLASAEAETVFRF